MRLASAIYVDKGSYTDSEVDGVVVTALPFPAEARDPSLQPQVQTQVRLLVRP